MFDVVGGTSIGGILALGCTASFDGIHPVINHDEIMDLFQKYGSTIFNANKIVALFNNIIDRSKYDNQGIEYVLNKYFQNLRLSDVVFGTNVIATAVKRDIQ